MKSSSQLLEAVAAIKGLPALHDKLVSAVAFSTQYLVSPIDCCSFLSEGGESNGRPV